MTIQLLLGTVLAVSALQAPTEIPKSEWPAKAECVVCNSNGENHGAEKPAGGVLYKGVRYFFCNSGEVAKFKSDPEAFLPPILPRPLPEFKLIDTSGRAWGPSTFEKKVVLIDFWATWCAPCKELMPRIERLYKAHKDKGFEVLGISIDEKKGDFDKFIAKKSFGYAVALDEARTWVAFKVKAIPATFLVVDGQIVRQWVGKPKPNELETAVQAALSK